MKKSNLIYLQFLLASFQMVAQPPGSVNKGVSPVAESPDGEKSGITRAVIVGISDYGNEAIPDLNYADNDALAFVDYLKSKAGGTLEDDQLRVLINEEATTAQLGAALDWLMEESVEGDNAYIYFSGHGDVETKTKMQHGFLLTYDSPSKVYIAGAFPLFYLQSIISTLSEEGVQVTVISDACHAGKLAGSAVGGTQATTSAMAKQFSNETKILSCQPNEFSLEGEQWGGGRGLFSYHLIDGLYGLADRNKDGQVTLLELERYLEDKVSTEATPQSQIPMTLGNKGRKLASVDKALLASLQEAKTGLSPLMASLDTRGMEQAVLTKVDEKTRKMYADFKSALKKGNLLTPEGASANDYYELLIREKSMETLHSALKRNLAAALQDDAQKALNAIINSDPEEMKAFFSYTTYKDYPAYLQRAAELLGESHYMYKSTKVKQYLFEAYGLLTRGQRLKDTLNHKLAIQRLHLAENLEANSSLVCYGLGFAHIIVDPDSADYYLDKAISLSPAWPMPYLAKGQKNILLHNFQEGIAWMQKSLEVDSNFFMAVNGLGVIHSSLGMKEKAAHFYQKAWNLAPGNPLVAYNLSAIKATQNEVEEALEWLEKALESGGPEQFEEMLEGYGQEHPNVSETSKWKDLMNQYYPGKKE